MPGMLRGQLLALAVHGAVVPPTRAGDQACSGIAGDPGHVARGLAGTVASECRQQASAGTCVGVAVGGGSCSATLRLPA